MTAHDVATVVYNAVSNLPAKELPYVVMTGPDAGDKGKQSASVEIVSDDEDGDVFYVIEVTRHRRGDPLITEDRG